MLPKVSNIFIINYLNCFWDYILELYHHMFYKPIINEDFQ